ncbi:hypothetical protein HK097_004718, partial [Rhizophlyctis rosea]
MKLKTLIYSQTARAVQEWPLINAFKQTSLTWKLTLADPTERRNLNAYWDIYGVRRMSILSSMNAINCAAYLITQFIDKPSTARTWRMGAASFSCLGATLLPTQLSIVSNRIYDVWIVHACRVHGIDLKLLDIRAQYNAELKRTYNRMKGQMRGSNSSLRSVAAPQRKSWRQRWKSVLLQWEDTDMEKRHRTMNYEASFPIVISYLVLYLIKHIIVSLINTSLSQNSTYAIGIIITSTIILLLANHLTRFLHNPILYPTYALLCMSYAIAICYIFLYEAQPHLTQCCSPTSLLTLPLSTRAAARAKAFYYICPVTGQMLNVATLFRLP